MREIFEHSNVGGQVPFVLFSFYSFGLFVLFCYVSFAVFCLCLVGSFFSGLFACLVVGWFVHLFCLFSFVHSICWIVHLFSLFPFCFVLFDCSMLFVFVYVRVNCFVCSV